MAIKISCGAAIDGGALTLVKSLIQDGYCWVRHDSLGPEVLGNMKAVGRRFFQDVWPALPAERRARVASLDGSRGVYRVPGTAKDAVVDCLSIGREVSTVEEARALREGYYERLSVPEEEYLPLISRMNPWEDIGDREVQEVLTAGFEAFDTASMDIMECIDGVVHFVHHCRRRWAQDPLIFDDGDCKLDIKISPLGRNEVEHVPPTLKARGPRKKPFFSYEDFTPSVNQVKWISYLEPCAIALIIPDASGSLEVYNGSHRAVIAVQPVEDAVCVVAGTVLERCTCHYIQAMPYRLTNRERGCSVEYFVTPRYDERIRPLLALCEEASNFVDKKLQHGCSMSDMLP